MADLSKPLIAFDQISKSEEDPSFWESMGAMYGYSYRPILGTVADMQFEEDQNFNVFDHLTNQDLDNRDEMRWYAMAKSQNHLNFIRTHLGKMTQNRETMSRSGWGKVRFFIRCWNRSNPCAL